MFIRRKKYEADLAQARRDGKNDAWDMVREFLKCLPEESEEGSNETKTVIPAVPQGVSCPPDRLDI